MKAVLLFAFVLMSTVSSGGTPIDSQEEVTIGGIRQFITLQGKDNKLPLLLFLHGGPGGSVISYADRFTDQLREHFIVVQWDQRETGKTRALNRSPEPLSLGLFQRDTYELIRVLLTRFKQDKLFLVGHSWGTALGFHIARTHPELLYAWIPVGPMINQFESERTALSIMKEHALTGGNQKALEELSKVHIPFENGEQLYYHRKWLREYSGGRGKLSRHYVETWAETWLSVFNEASGDNLFNSLPSVQCPVYFFAGRKDLQTNALIAEAFCARLVAPSKGFFWFETGHSIPGSDPGRLQDIIINNILPATRVRQPTF